ncbi:hypothetical protein LTR78_001552 [Recurvomyces mirabilis]|uniref:PEBP-like protein n=1 Tax=Recurvomyces mirabilis TaxID=574656 RepID=A0AAE1C4Y2_9PEZI|nr:hypothetical protein LTR78_001552 [Recurvomyces mirabilis]KAK5151875.1 hypothetical protein LTS14_009009 [Recurvomyces mirabilis]
MHFFSALALAATATAAAIPDAVLDKRTTTCTTAGSATLAAAKAAFTQAKLVPGVIPSFNPKVSVQVDYNGKQVNLGNTFSATETLNQPIDITFTAKPGYDAASTKYTIIMVDPDAPGPAAPILKDILHLIIDDAQPVCTANQNRKTIATYAQTTPLSVAAHRYTFLVYRQPPNYVPPPTLMYLPGNRAKFDLNAYVAQAGLIGPVGGNFFREGLGSTVCAVTPGCTQDGTGYKAPS